MRPPSATITLLLGVLCAGLPEQLLHDIAGVPLGSAVDVAERQMHVRHRVAEKIRNVGVERNAAVRVRLMLGLGGDTGPASEIFAIVTGHRLAPDMVRLHIAERILLESELDFDAAPLAAIVTVIVGKTLKHFVAAAPRVETLIGNVAARFNVDVFHEISADLIGMIAAFRQQQQTGRFHGMRRNHVVRALYFPFLILQRRHLHGPHRSGRVQVDPSSHGIVEQIAQSGTLCFRDVDIRAVARAARTGRTGGIRLPLPPAGKVR